MGFPLVPKSVTLNDLEQRNGRYFALYYVRVVKLDPYSLRQNCSGSFSNICYMDIFSISYRLLRKTGTPTRKQKFELCNIARPSQQQLSSC